MTDEKPQDDIIDIEPQVVSEESPKPRANSRALRNGGLVAVVALLAALGGGWLYRDVLASYLPNDELHALSIRVDALETGNKEAAKRMDAVIALTDELKAQLGAAQAAADKAAKTSSESQTVGQNNSAAIAALRQTADGLASDLAGLKSALTSGSGTAATDPAIAERLDAMEKRLAALQAAGPAKLDASALKQALASLNSKATSGAGFVDEITTIAQEVPAAEGLDVLKAASASGLPNNAQLGAALDQVMAQLPKPAAGSGSGDSWFDRVANFFSGLVTVKTLGSDDWPTAAAKASALVAAGDLQQADGVLGAMEGQPPAALADWRSSLQKRMAFDAALARVNAAVAREIAAKG